MITRQERLQAIKEIQIELWLAKKLYADDCQGPAGRLVTYLAGMVDASADWLKASIVVGLTFSSTLTLLTWALEFILKVVQP